MKILILWVMTMLTLTEADSVVFKHFTNACDFGMKQYTNTGRILTTFDSSLLECVLGCAGNQNCRSVDAAPKGNLVTCHLMDERYWSSCKTNNTTRHYVMVISILLSSVPWGAEPGFLIRALRT